MAPIRQMFDPYVTSSEFCICVKQRVFSSLTFITVF